jgi:hypothetical protein
MRSPPNRFWNIRRSKCTNEVPPVGKTRSMSSDLTPQGCRSDLTAAAILRNSRNPSREIHTCDRDSKVEIVLAKSELRDFRRRHLDVHLLDGLVQLISRVLLNQVRQSLDLRRFQSPWSRALQDLRHVAACAGKTGSAIVRNWHRIHAGTAGSGSQDFWTLHALCQSRSVERAVFAKIEVASLQRLRRGEEPVARFRSQGESGRRRMDVRSRRRLDSKRHRASGCENFVAIPFSRDLPDSGFPADIGDRGRDVASRLLFDLQESTTMLHKLLRIQKLFEARNAQTSLARATVTTLPLTQTRTSKDAEGRRSRVQRTFPEITWSPMKRGEPRPQVPLAA